MKGFGVCLEKLSLKNLEQVRQWRNQPSVAQFMEFQTQITPEQQRNWFLSIENALYFVIFIENKAVGLIDLKKIDMHQKSAESGLFIGESEFLGSGVALGASILLLDYAFDELNLSNVTAKMHAHNKSALSYNQFLGFSQIKHLENGFELWQISRTVYAQKRSMLVQIVQPRK